MTVLEQFKNYQKLRALGFPKQVEYTTRRDGEVVTVIQEQECIRHQDGTFERFTVELPVIKEVA